jgi:hypothetical protein
LHATSIFLWGVHFAERAPSLLRWVSSLSLIAFGLVLSAPNIFIPTSLPATYAPLFLHVYAHIGTMMPAHACTHES